MQGRDKDHRATILATYSSFILSSVIKERSRVRDRGGGVGEGEGLGVTPSTRCAFCRLCFVPLTTAESKGEDINTHTTIHVCQYTLFSLGPMVLSGCKHLSSLYTNLCILDRLPPLFSLLLLSLFLLLLLFHGQQAILELFQLCSKTIILILQLFFPPQQFCESG